MQVVMPTLHASRAIQGLYPCSSKYLEGGEDTQKTIEEYHILA